MRNPNEFGLILAWMFKNRRFNISYVWYNHFLDDFGKTSPYVHHDVQDVIFPVLGVHEGLQTLESFQGTLSWN